MHLPDFRGRWLFAAVMLGLLLRGYHYLRCPPVWQDEAALVVNVLQLSPGEMFGHLIHSEAAPPLFLVVERLAVDLLGDGVLALRLVPVLASMGSLLLVSATARRLLTPSASLLAVGLFAVSDRMLWHSCEAKSYSLDVFWAAAAGYWVVRTEGWSLWHRVLPVMLVAPVAIWTSFPACFIAGALLVAWLTQAIRSDIPGRLGYLLTAVAIGLAFVALAAGPVAQQRCAAMDSCWSRMLPDWSHPWKIPLWSLASTFEVARYSLAPFGQPMALLAVVGAVSVCRNQTAGASAVTTLLMPLALALLAALLGKYPYGGARVEAFAAPAICLLGSAGVVELLPRIAYRSHLVAGVVLAGILYPIVLAGWVLVDPWARPAADRGAAYVLAHHQEHEPILVNHWEYEYYFRSMPRSWQYWDGSFDPRVLNSTQRLWLVMTGDADMPAVPFLLPDGWTIIDRQEFSQVVVFKLARSSDDRQ